MQATGYEFGQFSKKTWAGDLLYTVGALSPLINPQPTYNVSVVDGKIAQPGEAQTGVLGVQSQKAAGGVSPAVVGAAALGTLLVGVVLVKVLD